ncbi:hypothetical protein [Nostoc commune]|uniref:hypothetical protein n=1 Tax=Nostoc commune TaxID=1178 RepID=UPI00207473C6|nr:hypothetical protein [Nostoc commune]
MLTKALSSVCIIEQPDPGHRFTKGMVISLPLILDIRQGTLQAQLHSCLESLD